MESLNAAIAWWATVPALAQELVRYANGLLLLTLVFLPLETLFALHPQSWRRQGWMRDIAYYFLSSLVPNKAAAIPIAALMWIWHEIAPQGLLPTLGALPLPARLMLSLLVAELGAYWAHRAMHAYPTLWRFHALHHAATEMHWLVNTRAHPIDLVFTRCCALLPLYLLGLVQPAGRSVDWLPLAVALITGLWGYVIHANVRWQFDWLEGKFSTPKFHHHHHRNLGAGGVNHANFAPTLAIFDRIFGTYEAPANWPRLYGSGDSVGNTMLDQIMLPFMPAIQAPGRIKGDPPRQP